MKLKHQIWSGIAECLILKHRRNLKCPINHWLNSLHCHSCVLTHHFGDCVSYQIHVAEYIVYSNSPPPLIYALSACHYPPPQLLPVQYSPQGLPRSTVYPAQFPTAGQSASLWRALLVHGWLLSLEMFHVAMAIRVKFKEANTRDHSPSWWYRFWPQGICHL